MKTKNIKIIIYINRRKGNNKKYINKIKNK